MVKKENQPVLDGDTGKGRLDGRHLHAVRGVIAGSRRGHLQVHLPRPSTLAKSRPAFVDEGPMQPRVEARWVPETRQLDPCGEQSLLSRIGGIRLIPEDG